jgi:class 3 adenylate cyclase
MTLEISVIIESILGRSSSNKIAISKSFLDINSTRLSQKYQMHVVKKFLWNMRMQFAFGFLCLIVISLTSAVIEKKIDQIFFVNMGITICTFALLLIIITRMFERNVEQFAWIMTIGFSVIAAFNSLVRKADHSMLSILITFFTTTNFMINFKMVFFVVVVQLIWYIASYFVVLDGISGYLWTLDLGHTASRNYALISLISAVSFIKIGFLAYRYKMERLVKREFIAGNVLQSRSNLTKDLLKLLLPSFVLDQMKSFDITGQNIDDDGVDAGEVTILFCDIADFDNVIKSKENEIVRLLDSIFRRFDELCKDNGCQKIETVGKTYMACGGLRYLEQTLSKDLREINPAARVLDLAKRMMSEIKSFEDLNLKIGIHKGRCMMGVIGYHKPQFSLIGDAVNTTSRHCTTGEKGHIMVSEDAWKELTGSNVKARGFTFTIVKTEMKGKGFVPVYHVMPLQNLIRKKLISIIEKYKSDDLPFPKELKIISKVILDTRQELKRKFLWAKISSVVNGVTALNKVGRAVNQELIQESRLSENSIAQVRVNGRKKTVNMNRPYDRSKARSQTKVLVGNREDLPLQPDNEEDNDSSGSEDEDAREVLTDNRSMLR